MSNAIIRTRRKALIAVTAVVLMGSAALATPALAATSSHTGPVAVSPHQTGAETAVSNMLTDYITSIESGSPDFTPEQVRETYLTPECNDRLHAWEAVQHADGVLQAQNIPVSWTTRYEGSGAGHTTVVVTFDWGGGNLSDVWYQVRLSDLRVSDVKTFN
jgi:hypothetical protein